MDDINLVIVKGRLGSNAYVGKPATNGRRMIRISVATNKERGGEQVTSWHTVHYWTGVQAEIESLTSKLIKGAKVLVQGASASYTRKHREHPVDMLVTYVEAASIDLLSLPVTERPMDGAEGEAYEELTPDPEAPLVATPDRTPAAPAPVVRAVAQPVRQAPSRTATPIRRLEPAMAPVASVSTQRMPILEF